MATQPERTLTKFTSSSSRAKFKDILPWNISEVITNTILINRRISYAMDRGIRVEFIGKSIKTETATWSKFPNEWKAIVEQIY